MMIILLMNDVRAVEKEPDKVHGWPEIEPWPAQRCDERLNNGGSRGGARGGRPPLFFHQTEAQRAEKTFLG